VNNTLDELQLSAYLNDTRSEYLTQFFKSKSNMVDGEDSTTQRLVLAEVLDLELLAFELASFEVSSDDIIIYT